MNEYDMTDIDIYIVIYGDCKSKVKAARGCGRSLSNSEWLASSLFCMVL
jgi:hypothetical protein